MVNRLNVSLMSIVVMGLTASVGCGDDEEGRPWGLEKIGPAAARSLPQVVETPGALTYNPGTTAHEADAFNLMAQLFRMECHDGQPDGMNFCPPGVEPTSSNVFGQSIVAQVVGSTGKLGEIYRDGETTHQDCAGFEQGGAIPDGGTAVYSPAGSDKFILASQNTLDCVGMPEYEGPTISYTAAYSKALDGERFYMVLTSRSETPEAEGSYSGIHQVYARMAEGEPQVVGFQLVDHLASPGATPTAGRIILVVNVAQHRYALKQLSGDMSQQEAQGFVAIGTAGYDPDGNYYEGFSVVRSVYPGTALPAVTFCIENGPDAGLATDTSECDAIGEPLLGASSGAWPAVSSFLDLTPEDLDALLGFGDFFDNGTELTVSDLPASLTDGFPISVTAE